MNDSAHTDPELSQWLRWASEPGNTPMFFRTVTVGNQKPRLEVLWQR